MAGRAINQGVRLAGITDASLLGRLLADFNAEFDSATEPVDALTRRFARILTDPDVLALLAVEDAGFALVTLRPAIWFDGPVAQLEELYVVPDRRGCGIGTGLVQAARRLVGDRGAPEIHINVDEEDTDARQFYERHGFVNIEPGTTFRMLCYVGPTTPPPAPPSP